MTVTKEDTDRIRSMDLKDEIVRQALAGYLCAAIQRVTKGGVYVGPQVIQDEIDTFVAKLGENVDLAVQMVNAFNKNRRRH